MFVKQPPDHQEIIMIYWLWKAEKFPQGLNFIYLEEINDTEWYKM